MIPSNMSDSKLTDYSMRFAVAVIKLCDNIQRRSVITNQLLRAATSVGANIREGKYGLSRADFIAKYQIAVKECYESEYWLELLLEAGIVTKEELKECLGLCHDLRRMLASALNTAKLGMQRGIQVMGKR